MKRFLFFPILCLYTLGGLAQQFNQTYGKIGQKEVDLIQYEQDTAAEAVVLFDRGESYFIINDNGFDVVFERQTRLKILRESGIKWAEIEIPYYEDGRQKEKIFSLSATTYNYLDGKLSKTELDPRESFEEKVNENWYRLKFALPEVCKGSIIEYSYKISSPYKFNLRDWEFQWRIPVVYSEYIVKTIPFYEYAYVLQGAQKFDVFERKREHSLPRTFGSVTFNDIVNRFVMKEVSAFESSDFISSINDYILKIDFQLSKVTQTNGTSTEIMTTWDKLIQDHEKHADFGKYVQKSERLAKKLFEDHHIIHKSNSEKFDYVLQYVKNNISWDSKTRKFASDSPKKIIERKFGNTADLNLLVVGFLRALGIKAYPVLISTRDHGKIMIDYPFAHYFNNVIVLAEFDDQLVLTDATEIHLKNNTIPPNCINDNGLIIQDKKTEWLLLQVNFPSQTKTNIVFDSDSAGWNANIKNSYTEYDALAFKMKYLNKREQLKNDLNENGYPVSDTSVKVHHIEEVDLPTELLIRFSLTPQKLNEKLFVKPFLNEVISENPFKQKERKYPVDFIYPMRRSYQSSIPVPQGYEVSNQPDNLSISNDIFKLFYQINQYDGVVIVTFDYELKKAVYQPQEYTKIKFYFDQIVKKGNEQLVLSFTNRHTE